MSAPLVAHTAAEHSDQLTLSSIPTEILLRIVELLDFPDLALFRVTSHLFNALLTGSSELIYKRLCVSHGYHHESSYSATAALTPRAKVDLEESCSNEKELQEVVEMQNAGFSSNYAQVDTWKEFGSFRVIGLRVSSADVNQVAQYSLSTARVRFRIDRRWLDGVCETKVLLWDAEGTAPIWRFKVDAKGGKFGKSQLIFTTLDGGTISYDPEGRDTWTTVLSQEPRAHIELSSDYICMHDRETFIIATKHYFNEKYNQEADQLGLAPSAIQLFHPPFPCQAFKLRYPLLVAYSPVARQIYVYNVERQALIHTIDMPTRMPVDVEVAYLEVDLDSAYIAFDGYPTLAFNTATGHQGRGWPGKPYDLREFTAMHYDQLGNYVAINNGATDNADLIWSWPLADGTYETAVLKMHDDIVQLAVENGRAAFLTARDGENGRTYFGLWYINLTRFESFASFKLNPPVPISLNINLPCFEEPARIEMTHDQIFCPINYIEAWLVSDVYGLAVGGWYSWVDSNGTVLVQGYSDRDLTDYPRAPEHTSHRHNDNFLIYDFGGIGDYLRKCDV